jgi:hypothetical protein
LDVNIDGAAPVIYLSLGPEGLTDGFAVENLSGMFEEQVEENKLPSPPRAPGRRSAAR